MSEDKYGKALCHRCEYRARFLEAGHGPRCECKDVGHAVCGCYMYRPVQPVVLAPQEGDKRPVQGGWMISARMRAAGLLDAEHAYTVTDVIKRDGKKAYVTWWAMKDKVTIKTIKKSSPAKKKKPAGKKIKVRLTKDGHVIW